MEKPTDYVLFDNRSNKRLAGVYAGKETADKAANQLNKYLGKVCFSIRVATEKEVKYWMGES